MFLQLTYFMYQIVIRLVIGLTGAQRVYLLYLIERFWNLGLSFIIFWILPRLTGAGWTHF